MPANEFVIKFRGKDVDASKAAREVRDNLKGISDQAKKFGVQSKSLADIWSANRGGVSGAFQKAATIADMASKVAYRSAKSLSQLRTEARGATASIDEVATGLGGGLDSLAMNAQAAVDAGGGVAAMAASFGLAAGGIVAFGAAATAAGVGAVMFTKDWAVAGRETLQSAQIYGVAADALQQLRGAGAQVGVQTDQVDASVESLGRTIQDALMGRNQEAFIAMRRLNLELKRTADGSVDTKAMLLQLADAYNRIPTAQGRALAAQMFGVNPRLLMQGAAGLQQRMGQFQRIGGVNSVADLEKARRETEAIAGVEQRWQALKRKAMSAVSPLARFTLDKGIDLLDPRSVHDRHLARAQRELGDMAKAWEEFDDRLGPTWDSIKTKLSGFTGGVADHVARYARSAEQGVESAWDGAGHWVKQTLGFRNNNPGNIRGASGEGGFRRYATMGAGLAAMGRLLRDDYQGKHGLSSIRQIESRYAPRSENDTNGLIARISRATGWSADKALSLRDPQQLATLERAMIGVEQGQSPFSKDDILAALGSPSNGKPTTVSRHHMDVYLHGLPGGASVRAQSQGDGSASLRIGQSMPPSG